MILPLEQLPRARQRSKRDFSFRIWLTLLRQDEDHRSANQRELEDGFLTRDPASSATFGAKRQSQRAPRALVI